MKSRFPFVALLLASGLFAGVAAHAKAPAKPIDPPKDTLPVIITETLSAPGNAFTDYDRLALGFEFIAKQRHWPVKIAVDRFAANVPDYTTQLLVTLQRVRQENPLEYVFRGWATLIVKGRKQDFGIVTFHYNARALERVDDVLENVFRGGANAIAEKAEPFLFPDGLPAAK